MSRFTSDLWLPTALWAVGGAALIAWSLGYDGAVLIAGLYVGLNGASWLLTVIRDRPLHPTALRVMAWCTAAQLPVMLVLIFDGMFSRSYATDAVDDVRNGAGTPSTDSAVRRRLDRSGRPAPFESET